MVRHNKVGARLENMEQKSAKLLLLVLALATSPALELDRSILAKLARSGGKRDLLKPNHVQVKVTKTHDSSFFFNQLTPQG